MHRLSASRFQISPRLPPPSMQIRARSSISPKRRWTALRRAELSAKCCERYQRSLPSPPKRASPVVKPRSTASNDRRSMLSAVPKKPPIIHLHSSSLLRGHGYPTSSRELVSIPGCRMSPCPPPSTARAFGPAQRTRLPEPPSRWQLRRLRLEVALHGARPLTARPEWSRSACGHMATTCPSQPTRRPRRMLSFFPDERCRRGVEEAGPG